jgi:hypothetical protein
MKRFVTVTLVFIVMFCCSAVMAQEKPLIIKGLYIGMDVNDARKITEGLLGKEWTVSLVGDSMKVLEDYRFGAIEIFGKKLDMLSIYTPQAMIGERGFAIISNSASDYNSYEGFIGADQNNRVTRISFSKKITNFLFSASKIDAEDFAPSFWKYYNMPEFGWIPYGWAYTSPNGYTVTIKTDKLIDIKKEDMAKIIENRAKIIENRAKKQSIKFE